MESITIRNVQLSDLDHCIEVETSGFPSEEAASPETIKLRIENYPQGFLVAELDGQLVGMLNSAATHKMDISDEALKQLIGHDPEGINMVVFALVVLPKYQKRGIARMLILRFAEESRGLKKENILLLCKQPLVKYYQSLGFEHLGLSKSTHGGAEWHTMRLPL